MLFVHGHKRIIILKARQIGFSTLLGIVCCDQLCFNPGQQISLIDQTLEDARQKLKNIVVLAYDSMAAELRAGLPIIRSNTGEVCVKYSRFEEAKASVMYAGTHSRGGSNSLVWVSEWGTIQATDIARSEEILTGALPSVGDGICVIESTWRGGRHGYLWVGRAGPGDARRAEGTVRLATRFFPTVRRSRLLQRGTAATWRCDQAILREQAAVRAADTLSDLVGDFVSGVMLLRVIVRRL
jgi:hypothetical protein